MLDLNTLYNDNLYQVKLFDGRVLNLKRPTQQLQETIIGMEKFVKTSDTTAIIQATLNLLVRIFNRNTEGIEFKLEDLEDDYDFSIAMFILKDYFEFYTQEVLKNVDFRNTQQ